MTIYDKGMRILLEIIVCFIAGMEAGLGTGFAGMSAAAVISPMLITFLGMPAYQAVGIALASDVLASAASAYTYGKNKNLDIRNGLIMMAAVLVMTMVGSWLASLMPDSTMGSFSVIMTLLLGVKFIAKPVMTTKELMNGVSRKVRVIQSVVCGIVIGFICGYACPAAGIFLRLSHHPQQLDLHPAGRDGSFCRNLPVDRRELCSDSFEKEEAENPAAKGMDRASESEVL